MNQRSRLRRMAKVLSMAFIIIMQIYWYKFRKKSDAEWELLWEDIGKRFRKTLFELEGLLIKIGQMLSIRSDLLPNAFIKQIQDLTDQVPPSNWEEIQAILESEWGGPIDQHFRSIDQSAVASASIGEVYKGILKNGTEVAIKVRRPHIQSIVHTDFRTLSIIIWFADRFVPIPKDFINFKVLFQELKQVIERELDFTQERKTLLAFKERYEDEENVKIPDVFAEYSTSKVLVMEWVNGIKITDETALNQLELNRHELAQRLIEIFLPQWLQPGTFHADPHAGNVLISKTGQVIMLDFGMTGEITKRDAANFQGLIESILSKNYAKAVECLIQLDFLLPETEPRTMERLLAELMAFQFQPNELQKVDLVQLKIELNDLIQALPIQVPTRFVFLGRSFITMEGMLLNLVTAEEVTDLLKTVFTNWLKKQGNNPWSFIWFWLQSQPIFKFFNSVSEFLTLPQRLENLKETEQRRQFQFTIYENRKKECFQLTILGIVGTAIGFYTDQQVIMMMGAGLFIAAGVGYLVQSYKLKRWMRFMHEKRRRK